MSKIEAVIFDWAGTTVDYGSFAPVQAFVEVFKQYGITPTIDEVRKPMGMLKRDHIQSMLRMERIHGLWLDRYKKEPAQEDIDQLYQLFETKLLGILDQFAAPKPYVLETVDKLRKMGIKIGSTTGYTDEMMAIVIPCAKMQGYEPDAWFSPNATGNVGRPYPFMIFRNLEVLQVNSVKNVIKVGDTISDIKEGKNAGVWSVGVVEGSSELALSQQEYETLSSTERETMNRKVKAAYKKAGADYVIRNLNDLMDLIEEIEKR